MKYCYSCNKEISALRLKSMPSAVECVSCLEAHGDVPKIKRFDESGYDGETISTFFTSNFYIEKNINRINTITPSDIHYQQAIGDDSHLVKEDSRANNLHGYGMSEAFEQEGENETTL